MRILGASALYDAAGDGARTKAAFDRHSDWRYRWAVRRPGRYGYPTDLPWPQARAEWRRADVVHLALGFEAETLLRAPRRPTVVHHHGTAFRQNRDQLLREQRERKATGLVSTLDLYLAAPSDLEWSPTPYDLGWLASLRRSIDDGILRIAHAPTNRDSKSTGPFLAAVGRLSRELRLDLLLVEGKSWRQCLAAKASADIYFDQVLTGYGCNAIEAWGMGIPVIAGVDAAEATRRGHSIPAGTLDEMVRRFGSLPFVLADEGTIYEALRLLAEPSSRATWAARGLAHVRAFHDEVLVVPALQRVFEAAA
jgi:hypothetical protein